VTRRQFDAGQIGDKFFLVSIKKGLERSTGRSTEAAGVGARVLGASHRSLKAFFDITALYCGGKYALEAGLISIPIDWLFAHLLLLDRMAPEDKATVALEEDGLVANSVPNAEVELSKAAEGVTVSASLSEATEDRRWS
jgi:hypothetical protein